MNEKPVVKRYGDQFWFWCPGCQENHAPSTAWKFNGDFVRPTFSPSILVNGNPKAHNPTAKRCHSFVENGMIRFLADCDHELKGQTVPLPPYED